MHVALNRFSTTNESTIGTLLIDGVFQCFTLEDSFRLVKMPEHTRISEGVYDINLRSDGDMDARYKKQFGEIHKGMLWLLNVPQFEWIYIHYGNAPKNTHGCILVGDNCHNNTIEDHWVGNSISAYLRIYKKISEAIIEHEPVKISINMMG